MNIHHIGYAVKDIKKAFEKFKDIGYMEETEIIKDEFRKVDIQFIIKDGYRIELVSPNDKDSPVNKIVNKSCAPYHICYETTNLEENIKYLIKRGYTLFKEPEAAIAINNRKVAFLFSRDLGLVEILEK
ncbi:VOC family protein [Clostridium tyrobutyricum]|uniref:VOC family protein n=1 Tax=Clostridium tyrobutyricum TaxID=1519 RepID=UPI000303858E|nr:VOC family protein [Clostridium tyrobutyricum]